MNAVAPSARTFLYVPAHRRKLLDKALSGATGADVVIVDLEDGVPADARPQALANLNDLCNRSRVATQTLGRPPALCRIRPGRAARFADLALVPPWFDGVVLAKAEDVGDLLAVAHTVTAGGSTLTLWPLIESARGVENLPAMLATGVNVGGVLLGAGDLRADLGLLDDSDQRQIDFARSRIIYACVAAEVEHIVDTPEGQIDPDEAFEAAGKNARGLGFTGKCAIHPNQIAPIKSVFTPTTRQLVWAERVVTAKDGAQRLGEVMVDEATKRTARRLLATARAGADDGHL